jgi:uncharacterized membrane protein
VLCSRAGAGGVSDREAGVKRALGVLAVSQVVYGLGSRPPAATRALVGLMLATSALEARRAGDGRAVAAAGAVGFTAELVGVATGRPFGHYHYSSRLGPRVGGVPLLAGAAWAMMARPAWVVASRLTRRRSRRIVLAAGALTAWDVFLDPRMVRERYWTWPGGGRYEGVPASNFAGWMLTGLLVFSAYSRLARGRASDEALALYVWTWVGEAFANAALWERPRVAAAGGAAMGAFAVPALVRRLRG